MTLKEWLAEERKTKRRQRGFKRGTQAWLASMLNCTQGEVSKWVCRRREPQLLAPHIVRLSGGKVTLKELTRVAP